MAIRPVPVRQTTTPKPERYVEYPESPTVIFQAPEPLPIPRTPHFESTLTQPLATKPHDPNKGPQ